jgi:hypothetical protein
MGRFDANSCQLLFILISECVLLKNSIIHFVHSHCDSSDLLFEEYVVSSLQTSFNDIFDCGTKCLYSPSSRINFRCTSFYIWYCWITKTCTSLVDCRRYLCRRLETIFHFCENSIKETDRVKRICKWIY